MTFRPIVRSICVVGICLLAGRSIAAQSADVVIRGLATDESRAGVPGVTITATNTETGLQRSTITDMTGRYAILSVPAGTYDIASELSGFQTVVRRQQTFNVGTTITIDFTMLVAGLAETIEVPPRRRCCRRRTAPFRALFKRRKSIHSPSSTGTSAISPRWRLASRRQEAACQSVPIWSARPVGGARIRQLRQAAVRRG